ncbi:beta-xylosidase [Paraflavitalea sp. CAU 1676]|uniref:GH39 family glycosyl hydrolase n=1 Tax=Paraflavitalea sp. CAU 1676 TaxID=3032598 RepID=UPI0023DC4427|nr:beta-xylosidase [Paraflavitalea sp. CAU 1676]MDF2190472.1 beta-xylosidase [Paraflavitalea sp. CAU 1676]
MKRIAIAALFSLVYAATPAFAQDDTVQVKVAFDQPIGDMKPVWAWFGYDEPNYTYMKDGKKLLSELAALSPVPVYVRAHNLLTSGDGQAALKWGSTNAYTEDAQGNPVYNWRIVDSIFDTYVQRGMKPLAQIGFMPEALSVKPQPYRHYWKPGQPYKEVFTGWAHPPKDYSKWGNLVYEWVKHCVERYGKKEVASWYWELWNEPNGNGYWQSTVEEYCKLYDYTADAVKRALPAARIGGPHVTGPSWNVSEKFLRTFLEHVATGNNYVTGKKGTPIDFIAFHAKGAPRVVDGHVRMGISNQLKDISKGFEIVANTPAVKDLPIVIGESDPEGCAACGMATNPENAYRNGTMYSSYTAASFARKYLLADHFKVNFLGAVSWSFEFEDQPWFYGFRDLATNGVDKPVLNIFRMFGMMKGKRVDVASNRMYPLMSIRDSGVRKPTTDIGALAAYDKKLATVMLWNYHDDDLDGKSEPVNLQLKGLSAKTVTITQYTVDKKHSNSYEVWKQMGSPQQPTAAQIATLEKAGQLEQTAVSTGNASKDGLLLVPVLLQRQGVVLVKITWK